MREATAMRSLHRAAKSSPHSPQLEKAHVQQRRPNTAKNKQTNYTKKQNKTNKQKNPEVTPGAFSTAYYQIFLKVTEDQQDFSENYWGGQISQA